MIAERDSKALTRQNRNSTQIKNETLSAKRAQNSPLVL